MGKTGIVTCSVNVWDFLTGVSKAGHSWVQTSFKQKTNNQTKQMSASHFLLHEIFNFKETVEMKHKKLISSKSIKGQISSDEERGFLKFMGHKNLSRQCFMLSSLWLQTSKGSERYPTATQPSFNTVVVVRS